MGLFVISETDDPDCAGGERAGLREGVAAAVLGVRGREEGALPRVPVCWMHRHVDEPQVSGLWLMRRLLVTLSCFSKENERETRDNKQRVFLCLKNTKSVVSERRIRAAKKCVNEVSEERGTIRSLLPGNKKFPKPARTLGVFLPGAELPKEEKNKQGHSWRFTSGQILNLFWIFLLEFL